MRHTKSSGLFLRIGQEKLFLMIVLFGFSLVSTSNEVLHPVDSIERYLQSLPGFWSGEAIETPVGSMNYDMFFHSCSNGTIAGVAKTGASLHYWQFMPDQENFRLRFLSTFGGNRRSTLLLPWASEGEKLKFYAPGLKLLTLEFTFSKRVINIRVFHHDKPHVHIRLARANIKPTELSSHHAFSNSCQELPLGK